MQSLRAQYTKYLNNAYTAAINSDFSKESLDELHTVIRLGQSVLSSEFDDINTELKNNNIKRAADRMFDFQIKLDRYKRTGKI